MPDVAVSRKQRLRTLENQIRKNYEAFVATGFALKEIRDDELFKEDGFESWERYLKERVGMEYGIERTQAFQLIACAQIRAKLPDLPGGSSGSANDGQKWSQNAVYEFARLAPKDEGTNQGYDFDKLNKRDVERVAKKVIQHCEEEAVKPTSTIVRQFVDEELGIDRAAQGKETKRRREEEQHPVLHLFLNDMTARIEAETELLEENVSPEAWKLSKEQQPRVVKRLTAAVESLAGLLRRLEE